MEALQLIWLIIVIGGLGFVSGAYTVENLNKKKGGDNNTNGEK